MSDLKIFADKKMIIGRFIIAIIPAIPMILTNQIVFMVCGIFLITIFVIYFSLFLFKPLISIVNNQLYLLSFFGKINLIGNISNIVLTINKHDLYFRQDNKQDKILNSKLQTEQSWQKLLNDLQNYNFKSVQ